MNAKGARAYEVVTNLNPYIVHTERLIVFLYTKLVHAAPEWTKHFNKLLLQTNPLHGITLERVSGRPSTEKLHLVNMTRRFLLQFNIQTEFQNVIYPFIISKLKNSLFIESGKFR
jgi:hypothetical protein